VAAVDICSAAGVSKTFEAINAPICATPLVTIPHWKDAPIERSCRAQSFAAINAPVTQQLQGFK
jgi:hypothetical protein